MSDCGCGGEKPEIKVYPNKSAALNRLKNLDDLSLNFVKIPDDLMMFKNDEGKYIVTSLAELSEGITIHPIDQYVTMEEPDGTSRSFLTKNNLDTVKSQIERNYEMGYIAVGDKSNLTFDTKEQANECLQDLQKYLME